MPSATDDNFQALLVKLDSLLMEGFQKYRALRDNYFKIKDQEGFNLETFTTDGHSLLNNWYSNVYSILDNSLAEPHHLFHFIQHKSSSMILSNVPEKLSKLLLSFEYHLYALEEVILRLEEKRSLEVRREIAEKEYQVDTLYKITYSTHTRELLRKFTTRNSLDWKKKRTKQHNGLVNSSKRIRTTLSLRTRYYALQRKHIHSL